MTTSTTIYSLIKGLEAEDDKEYYNRLETEGLEIMTDELYEKHVERLIKIEALKQVAGMVEAEMDDLEGMIKKGFVGFTKDTEPRIQGAFGILNKILGTKSTLLSADKSAPGKTTAEGE